MKKRISSVLSYLRKNREVAYIVITVAIIFIMLITELLLSNARTMLIDKDEYETDVELLEENPVLLVKGEAISHVCDGVPNSVYAIEVGVYSENGFAEPIVLEIDAVDKKNANWYTTVEKTYIAPERAGVSYHRVLVDFDRGSYDLLRLRFSSISEDAQLVSVVVNPSDTFSFSGLRFALLCFVALAIFNFAFFRLNREIFDIKNHFHAAVAVLTIVLCVVITSIFCSTFVEDRGDGIKYPIEEGLEGYSPYIQQTDAFIKGQLHIDIKVPDALLELENPYDCSARSEISYLWDRAMYNGNYYSYFGIAPILNVYLPYYMLNDSLPEDTVAVTFYAIMATLFTCLFVYGFVVIYKKRVPVSLLSLAVVSIVFSSGIMLVARSIGHFYYLAVISAMAYMMQFLFFVMIAINCSHKVLRPVFFALASVSYGFLLMSRLNMAVLVAFIVVPVVIYCVILNRSRIDKDREEYKEIKRTTKQKILDIACLGSFALVALIFTLCYNYARFDNIFEFGTSYQLTVSDISQNSFSATNLVEFIYHYFAQPFDLNGIFPYFGLSGKKMNTYGTYMYVDTGMGLFAIPLMLGLLLCVGLFKSKKKTGFVKCLTACALAGVVIVSLMNFSMGGVIYRYTCDITLLCAIMSVLFIFSFNERLEESEGVATVYRIEKALMIFSIIACALVSVSLNPNLAKYSARTFVNLFNAFS